jgi:integrase
MKGKPRGTLATDYAPHAPHAVRRFEHAQGALLRGDLVLYEPGVRLAAFLVAFDGVATCESLIDALGACRTTYAWNDAVCIDWKAPCGRIDRRHLSVWTRFALAQPNALLNSPEQALQTLDQCFQELAADRDFPRSLDTFIGDSQAWLAHNLAGPWFAHAIGAARLAALPRSVFARECSKKALPIAPDKNKQEGELLAESAMGLALDAYLSGDTVDGGYWLVDEVMAICQATTSRRAMVKNLLTISTRSDKGRISSLVLAWATDLAESGTPGDADISPRTVSKYVRAIARDLLDQFRRKFLEELKSEEFDKRYREIIQSKPVGAQRTCASALSSWHFFLVCWLDVAPRTRSLHRDLPEPIPKANAVWPHELKTIAEWLAKAEESRLIRQTGVAFAIAGAIRIRTNELIRLRLKNVRVFGNVVEIEICTSVTDGGLKSRNARRSQAIECPMIAATVSAWKQRRLEELAMPNDYLFGDPHRAGKPYCPGQMQLLMNRLLKDVTGDPSVSIHTLSHSWATNKFLQASCDESILDVNRFDALSAEAGHGDASMTLTHYVHRCEEAIRREIDTAIAPRLRWPEMSPFVNMNHDTYRQRLSRQKRSMAGFDDGQCKLQLVRAAIPSFKLPAADSGIETGEPMTTALGARTKGVSLGMAIDVLIDLELGTSVETAALRACLTQEDIVRIAHQAMEILVELGEFRPGCRTQGLSDVADALRIALHGAAHGRIDFSKIRQTKLLTLREFLARSLSDPSVRDGMQSWLKCYRSGYVSLAQPSHTAALIRLLSKSGVSASAIGIFCIPASDPASLRLKEEIDAVFVQEYAAMPLTKECGIRGGRPPAYLAISGTDFTHRASSATLCMKGLNALMLSACVLDQVSSRHADKKQ